MVKYFCDVCGKEVKDKFTTKTKKYMEYTVKVTISDKYNILLVCDTCALDFVNKAYGEQE